MKGQPFSSVSPGYDSPLLRVKDLTFLGNGPYSFSLDCGECLGLSGRSGVGKTQLLRALTDLITHGGEVALRGIIAEEVPAPEWRQQVGLVPADPCWWHDRVGAHFPGRLLSEVHFTILKRLGFGPEVLDWEVSRLSSGERQRLAFVRAVIFQPTILLLDEPTSGLDSYHTSQFEDLIYEFRSGGNGGVIWVSHDAAQLQRVASRVLIMEPQSLLPQ